MRGAQTIDTAPRDGSRVIAAEIRDGRVEDMAEIYWVDDGWRIVWGTPEMQPTHWMPA